MLTFGAKSMASALANVSENCIKMCVMSYTNLIFFLFLLIAWWCILNISSTKKNKKLRKNRLFIIYKLIYVY